MRLLASLEKGNKASVTVIRDGQEIKAMVAANPRMMRFDFYDAGGRAMSVKPVEKQQVARAEKLPGSQQQSQAAGKKESAKTELAASEKNNKTEQKKRGLKI